MRGDWRMEDVLEEEMEKIRVQVCVPRGEVCGGGVQFVLSGGEGVGWGGGIHLVLRVEGGCILGRCASGGNGGCR